MKDDETSFQKVFEFWKSVYNWLSYQWLKSFFLPLAACIYSMPTQSPLQKNFSNPYIRSKIGYLHLMGGITSPPLPHKAPLLKVWPVENLVLIGGGGTSLPPPYRTSPPP